MSMANHLDALTDEITKPQPEGSGRPRSARTMPAPAQLVHGTAEFRRMEGELEELQRNKAGGTLLKLASLRPSPYQVGNLEEDRVGALVENLRVNPLTSPIVVREIAPGVFEILAGHHRAESYRRLGRDEIFAVVARYDDDEAERLVFFDNLLAPSLSDFAKYKGFARRRESRGHTLESLAQEAGVSVTLVANLLSYGRLPAPALAVVEQFPKCLGSSAASALAVFAKDEPDRVTQFVALLAEGKVNQTRVAQWMKGRPEQPRNVAPVVIRQGKAKYAELAHRGVLLSVRFAVPEEAERLRALVEELLRKEAIKAKA